MQEETANLWIEGEGKYKGGRMGVGGGFGKGGWKGDGRGGGTERGWENSHGGNFKFFPTFKLSFLTQLSVHEYLCIYTGITVIITVIINFHCIEFLGI
jgi:hypothetical protein